MNETYNNRIRLNEVLLNGAVSMGKGGDAGLNLLLSKEGFILLDRMGNKLITD